MKRIIHHFDQQTPQWVLQRIGKATSSRFTDAMTQDRAKTKPGKTARKYLAEILAQIDLLKAVHAGHCEYADAFDQFSFQTRAMENGNIYEQLALQEYTDRTGNQVERIGFIEFDSEPIGSSTDGLIGDDGVAEVKCPNSATHRMWMSEGVLPAEHVTQVQGELWVAGKAFCDFISFDWRLPPGEKDLWVLRVERDEEKIGEIAEKIMSFVEHIPRDPFDFPLSEIKVTTPDELRWANE